MVHETKTKKLIVAVLSTLLMASVAYAVGIVWERHTEITVIEPFEVTSDLPTSTVLYPNSYSYTINVTNHGGQPLNATLCYSINTVNCTVNITPANGTSYTVQSSQTVKIPVNINITIDNYPANGTATIDWRIERSPLS
jgi:hypothetical protein